MKKIYERLGADASAVNVVFITVDPQRDTAQRLDTYTQAFNPYFIGLTGGEEELSTVWSDYGVFREVTTGDTALGYLISHTARVYLVDRLGRLRLTYAFGTPVDDIFSDLKYLLKEKSE
jgi:protein SCO1/2